MSLTVKKVMLGSLFTGALLIVNTAISKPAVFSAPKGYTLEQVILVGRHGLRAPLATGGSELANSSDQPFPSWHTKGSWMTTNGEVLETYLGQYIGHVVTQAHLLRPDACPTAKNVKIYANSKQRTLATAEFFSAGAFPGCSVEVEHHGAFDSMDNTFNPSVHNASAQFKQQALQAMSHQASATGIKGMNDALKPAYQLLSKLTNFKNSPYCHDKKICQLSDIPTSLSVVTGKEPGIKGPLRLGTIISDALILEYYEGFKQKDVVWGKIKTQQQWRDIAKIKDTYGDVLFGAPLIAKDVAKPLIQYINQIDGKNKLTVLIGHDSNIISLLSALGAETYHLPNTLEATPIGGMVAIERWKDAKGEQFVKLEYIYQSTEQLRQKVVLDDAHPPMHVGLSLHDCKVDKNGMCSYDTFKHQLTQI